MSKLMNIFYRTVPKRAEEVFPANLKSVLEYCFYTFKCKNVNWK